ncbi:hypothetical protein LWI29_032307 [Acer saccharum]|uniref:Protein kinase domain-containing protein n=1 Tax=Acer saccharum TaxID=4024 RepID=A0AA39SJI3_ACESA|nr:hypothetical protein LWI29_032307 [Acer saccharum]
MIPPLLFQLMILLSWPINALAESSAIAKPGCRTLCGKISIPFPFGIGDGCYLDDWYEVTCNSSRPFLKSINLEVLNISISLEASTMLVNQTVSRYCNLESSRYRFVRNATVNLESSPFFFSDANRFTGVGCNNFAYLSSNTEMISGCISVCNKIDNSEENSNVKLRNSGCNGIQCCQTRIPSSLMLQQLDVTLRIIGDKKKQGKNKCKSAFLVDQEWLGNNIDSPEKAQGLKHVPVLLDWGIFESSFVRIDWNSSNRYNETFNCLQMTNDMSYSTRVRQCSCRWGYEGNPYLLQGCQVTNCRNGSFDCYPYRINPHIKSKITMVMLGIGIGFGGLFLLIGAWWLYIIVKRRKNIKLKEVNFKRNGGLLLQQQLTSSDGSVDRSKLFTSKELDKATDHFHTDRILGQGGQGTVYKGMLTDGKIVAVKKSKAVDEWKIEEFINEVAILSQINHRNVVKLLGCCLETEVPLLVYEFIPNGTLLHYLHNQAEEFPLTWDMRLRIATEVAGALCYLHSAASFPIYHRDIKSANILLDEKYKAKVADFGTSRSIAIDQTHVTTKVQGTFGYLDPEYFQSSQFTDKSDVYSFGVVLVELLTGQKAISSTRSQDNKSLATHFIVSMVENNLFDILDPEVIKVSKKEEIITVANLAKRCLNLNGKKRPTMKEVAMVLEGIQASQKESNVQQNYEEVEYVRTESIEPWDVVPPSTSIGIGFGGLFLLIGAWWLYIIVKRRKNIKLKEVNFKRNGGLLLQQQLTSSDGSVDRSKLFTSKELDKATDHFHTDRILGQGGQGTVYKGMLTDGKIVAVKKSKAVDEWKIEEFINEVAILSQINHRNVVKLLGCCLETEVPLLVYEFIPNGTLLHYLHNQAEEFPLTWDMRLRIATEVAGALCYLHSAASFPIYHRDIKSANILLDEKYRAKVADFGTSRSIAIDQTHVTTKVQGTFGYLDPEYFQSSQFTDKSDVYSFGVVLIELLTGQKAISSTRSQDNKSLATHFIVSMVENNLFDILDPEVIKVSKKEEIMTVANLAKRCLNLNGKERPTMKEVAMVLEGIQASQKESNVQQNYEEVENVRTELIEPWDVVSTSTSSTFEIVSKSVDVQPLLTNM